LPLDPDRRQRDEQTQITQSERVKKCAADAAG
jgi:hypothetical protein